MAQLSSLEGTLDLKNTVVGRLVQALCEVVDPTLGGVLHSAVLTAPDLRRCSGVVNELALLPYDAPVREQESALWKFVGKVRTCSPLPCGCWVPG